jgi:hypothetical protein
MTFEGGAVDDPTLNIRSPGASGACESSFYVTIIQSETIVKSLK